MPINSPFMFYVVWVLAQEFTPNPRATKTFFYIVFCKICLFPLYALVFNSFGIYFCTYCKIKLKISFPHSEPVFSVLSTKQSTSFPLVWEEALLSSSFPRMHGLCLDDLFYLFSQLICPAPLPHNFTMVLLQYVLVNVFS